VIANINGYQAYQKNKYETASPHRLITMLYEGAIRFGNQSIGFIERGDIDGKNQSIQRFQDIIFELISCLNFNEGKEIANNLYTLYTYVLELSTRSNIEKSTEPLKEAISIIADIKSSWEQIGKEVQMNG